MDTGTGFKVATEELRDQATQVCGDVVAELATATCRALVGFDTFWPSRAIRLRYTSASPFSRPSVDTELGHQRPTYPTSGET